MNIDERQKNHELLDLCKCGHRHNSKHIYPHFNTKRCNNCGLVWKHELFIVYSDDGLVKNCSVTVDEIPKNIEDVREIEEMLVISGDVIVLLDWKVFK